MPQEEQRQHGNLAGLLPDTVYKALVDNDIDLDSAEVRIAVITTFLASQKYLSGRHGRDTSLVEYLASDELELSETLSTELSVRESQQQLDLERRERIRGILESLKERQITKIGVAQIIAFSIGLAAMGATLISNLGGFIEALRSIYPFSKFFGELVGIFAYADTPNAAVSPANSAAIPIFIYGIYLIFGLAYIALLAGLFFGKAPKDRANAMELLKTLTAFFVGVISGKFV